MEVIARHREGDAPTLIEINEAASPAVSELIVEMMAVEPDERPQTMMAVREKVKDLLESS